MRLTVAAVIAILVALVTSLALAPTGAARAGAAGAARAAGAAGAGGAAGAAGAGAAGAAGKSEPKPDLRRQVFEAESSFAHTMAARDHKAFGEFVALDAIFFGRRAVLRGRAAVSEGWKPLFEGPKPPFSWRPEVVEVLDSGTLAHSSGPVHDPDGKLIGKFNSVWRLEPDGHWRVVFDKGCDVCDSTKAQ